jgi:uncharacterized protein (DUF433 family)
MNVQTIDRYISHSPDIADGKPHLAGRRLTVQNIAIWHEQMGYSVDEIAEQYNLSLAEIYAALAYYYDHKEEIDQDIADDDLFIAQLKAQTPSKLAQKL